MSDQKVKKQKAGKAFVYRVRFTHDGRGQLKNHTYEKYVSASNCVELIRRMEIWYDLAGNMSAKKFTDDDYDWVYEFTHDTGYRLTGLVITNYDAGTSNLNWTYTYDFDHDLRGNVRACSCVVIGPSPEPRLVDLPNTMKYDSHNRLVEYEVTRDVGDKVKLYYDPVGRVFRKEIYTDDALDSATHYFYNGGNLIQEFDEMVDDSVLKDDIIWDYLRGLGGQVVRRRTYEEEAAVDKLHFNDMMGTVREETDPKLSGTEGAGTVNGYVVTADGEPLEMDQPPDENHIQFHGGFLEDANFHTNPAVDGVMGYFYRMGIRHYSPSLGRFLQRDPLTYTHLPNERFPENLNPYIYAYNCPTQFSDVTGYQACPNCGTPSGNIPTMPATLPNGSWSGTDTGGSGGGGLPKPGSPNEYGCAVRYPVECGCWSWGCCIRSDEPEPSPCDPCTFSLPTCIGPIGSIPPQKWSDGECWCWCCELRAGGEHAPQSINTVETVAGGNPSVLSPKGGPNIGGDDAGEPPIILPVIPPSNPGWFLLDFVSPWLTPFFPIPPQPGWRDGVPYYPEPAPRPKAPKPVKPPRWSWNPGMGRWAIGALISELADYLGQRAIGYLCDLLKKGETCIEDDPWRECLCYACNVFNSCMKHKNIVSIGAGVIGAFVTRTWYGAATAATWAGYGWWAICGIAAMGALSKCMGWT
jgi:RHS repeat-associated protein